MRKRFLAFIISFCLILGLMPLNSYGQMLNGDPITSGNITWEIDESGANLEVTINGDWEGQVPWYDSRENIEAVSVKGQGASSLKGLFKDHSKLDYVDMRNLDTSTVTDMSEMFMGCTSLTSVDLKKFDVSKVTSFEYMFSGCSALTSVKTDNWRIGAASISLKGMFENCSSIKSIDLSAWGDRGHITSLEKCFSKCSALETVNFKGVDLSALSSIKSAFEGDSKLSTKLTLSNTGIRGNTAFAFRGAATAEKASVYLRYVDDSMTEIVSDIADSFPGSKITVWKIPVISKDAVTVSEDKLYYDGKEQKPKVTVKVDDVTLTEGTDYELLYQNNIKVGADATVTVKGIEDYRGSIEKKFSISMAINPITCSVSSIQKTRSGSAQSCSFTAKSKYGKPTVSCNSSKVKATIDKKGKVSVKIPAKYMGICTITLKSPSGEKYDSDEKKIKVVVGPTGTSISSLISTMDDRFTVKWKKNSTVTGYQIRYSANSDMKDAVTKTVTSNKTLSKTFTGFKSSANYYVQVRTFKTVNKIKITSGWSVKKVVKIKVPELNHTELKVYKGESKKLKVVGTKKKVSWSSSNKNIATVDSKGNVKGKKDGKVTITAKVGKVKLTCTVTVKTATGYEKLQNYIEEKGTTNSDGNKIIKDDPNNPTYAIVYNAKYNRFEFIYLKDKTGMTMNVPTTEASSITAVYVYSNGGNHCKSSGSFVPASYTKSSTVKFVPSVYIGHSVSEYNDMANSALKSALTGWSSLVKKAGTNMKGIGFKSYE